MNFYLLRDPKKHEEYARYSHRGTWSEGQICPSCNLGTSILTPPLQIEWEPDSDLIADFSWCGYTAIVKEPARCLLESFDIDCEFSEIKVLPPSNKTNRKIVAFPYIGPTLYWLRPKLLVDLDIEKSDTPLLIDCPICGQKKYKFKTSNLVAKKQSWNSPKIFHLRQFQKNRTIYVTEEMMNNMKHEGFTNLDYLLAGELL